jgi:putative ABC transport system permease protein
MSTFSLVWSYLRSKPLQTGLNIILLSLGIAVITLLLLLNNQIEQKITKNGKGIDLVVGAKGSPLQLILCAVFHADFPTGNINLAEAERITRHSQIEKAIPVALGDSYGGYRVVGTTHEYATLYHAELAQGVWWTADSEVVVGARVADDLVLQVSDSFVSTHGLTAGGEEHPKRFIVKGVMKPTHTVLDNLILTSVESIWAMHDKHDDDAGHEPVGHVVYRPDSSQRRSRLLPTLVEGDSAKEITSVLIKYRSPMGAILLPRLVNTQSSLQAASPAFEIARLFSILGVGVDILSVFASILIFISALSIFIALYNSLSERKYDLAIMRTMGATRWRVFSSVILEGVALTFFGSLIGLLMAHGAMLILPELHTDLQKAELTGLAFYTFEWIILAFSLLLGVLCSLLPAIQAYRTNISNVLAEN